MEGFVVEVKKCVLVEVEGRVVEANGCIMDAKGSSLVSKIIWALRVSQVCILTQKLKFAEISCY